jgi:hypothetical protein
MAGEAKLWDFLRVRLPAGIHYSRIESLDTAPGFPDVHYTLQGQSGTMELKHAELHVQPFGHLFKDALRKSQKDWIEAELEAGGRVILVLQGGKTVYFLNGKFFRQLDFMTIEELIDAADLYWSTAGPCRPPDLEKLLLGLS